MNAFRRLPIGFRRVGTVAFAATFAMMFATVAMALADADRERPELVSVGFEGVYRTGSWTAVTVRLPAARETGSGAVFLWAEDPDGEFVRSPPARLATSPDGAMLATATVRFGRPTARVRVGFAAAPPGEDGATETVELPKPAASDEPMLLVLGEAPGIRRACRLLEAEGGRRPRPVEIREPSSLGRTPLDFDAADCLLVCGSAVTAGRTAWPEEVALAIDGWVRRGGALVLATGATTARIAEAGGVAADWLPGRFEKLVPLRRTASIETFARSSRPLETSPSNPLRVPLFQSLDEQPDAVREAFEGTSPGDVPLVVRRAHGFGSITWVGFDLEAPPMRTWQGTDSLLVQLLERFLGGPTANREARSDWQGASLDLTGQLRRAIDTYPGVAPVPFELIGGLAALHVFALYPASWWVLGRLKRRTGREPVLAAWLSLPLVVGGLACACWAVADRFHPAVWRSHRCGCLDVDAGDGSMRAFSFIGTWSPRNDFLDRSAGPSKALGETVKANAEVSWFAPAGRGIGGTDAASPHASLAAADYAYGRSLDALRGVPIAAASSRLFEARWHGRWPEVKGRSPAIAGRLDRDAQGTLRGSIQSGLPCVLDACVLAHAGWLYDVGPLAPGGSFDPAAGRGPRSLAGSLTRRAANRERDVPVRYDPESRDVGRILEVAGLHGAAGGSAYSTLQAGRLAVLDLSRLLETNRAILIGKGPAATEWIQAAGEPTPSDGNGSAGDAPAGDVWRIVIPIGRDLGSHPEGKP